MIKKVTLLFMFLVFIFFLFGCETTKGAFQGAKDDYKGAIRGTKEVYKGTAQIAKKAWQSAQEIDAWVQKNLW